MYINWKKRALYLLLIISTLIIGIASREVPKIFSAFFAEYLGDTLWAFLVFWILRFIFIEKSGFILASASLMFSYSIEISQLYKAVWLVELRQTIPGSLILGHGFIWSDLVCYTVGVLFAYLIDYLISLLTNLWV